MSQKITHMYGIHFFLDDTLQCWITGRISGAKYSSSEAFQLGQDPAFHLLVSSSDTEALSIPTFTQSAGAKFVLRGGTRMRFNFDNEDLLIGLSGNRWLHMIIPFFSKTFLLVSKD